MNKIKNTIAVITISVILTINIAGLSVNAYSPTITKTFSSGSGTATATLYRDDNDVYASLTCSNVECCIILTCAGITKSSCGYGYVSVYISVTNPNETATCYCVAGSASTSITL